MQINEQCYFFPLDQIYHNKIKFIFMLKPHRPISQDKNQQKNRYGPYLISELHKQQIAFKSFVSSLNKCPNRYLPLNQNPQQQRNKKISSSMTHRYVKNLQTPQKILINSKIETIERIKNSQDIPLTNFRICKIKNNQKSLIFDPFQTRSSRINKSINKSQHKNDFKKISKFQDFPSPSQINLEIEKEKDDRRFEKSILNLKPMPEMVKKTTTINLNPIKKLRLQKTSCLTWNPNSKQFLSSFFSSSNQSISTSQSNFLLSLLNLNIQNTINFLTKQPQTIQNIDELQVKSICSFFQNILELNQIKSLQEPLIKKYSNCIFYGEKPNFVGIHAGIILYFNGNSYFGSLSNFQKHGIGIELVKSQKLKQKKSIKKNMRTNSNFKNQSQGAESFIIYQGKFQRNSKTGLFKVNAFDYIYEGQLCKSLFEGQGTLINSKSTFRGKWQKNKKVEGLQIFNKEQMTYQGSYVEDKFHGFGQLRKNTQFYEGQFFSGQKSGRGIMVNKQFIFEGNFKFDIKHGKGTFFDKLQYEQKNGDLNKQDYDFKQCVYFVQFNEDYMIDKIQIKENQNEGFLQQNLQTFEEDKSDKSSSTIEFQNSRPSKILNKAFNDRLYEKLENSRQTFQNFQRYRRVLQVIPSQPEQQIQFTHKVNTYLTGNNSYRSPKKIIKQCS